jgi:hypothetical protein
VGIDESKRHYFYDCSHCRKDGPPILKSAEFCVSEMLASIFVGHLSNDFGIIHRYISGEIVKHCSAHE